jgi:hypothetical protein
VNKCSAGKVVSEASSKREVKDTHGYLALEERHLEPRFFAASRCERERGGKCVFVQLATEPGSFANNQKPRALALSSKHANATHLPRARFLLFALTHTDKRE